MKTQMSQMLSGLLKTSVGKMGAKFLLVKQFGGVYSSFVDSLSDEQRIILQQVYHQIASSLASPEAIARLEAAGAQVDLSSLDGVLELADSLGFLDMIGERLSSPEVPASNPPVLVKCPVCQSRFISGEVS